MTNYERIKEMSVEEMAELLDSFRQCSNCRRNGNNCFPTFRTEEWLILEVDDSIPNAATVCDMQDVVRCKDCKYYQDNNNGHPHDECKWCQDETPNADDFCSCGERKDNNA